MRVAISTAAAVTLAAGGAFGWYAWNNTSPGPWAIFPYRRWIVNSSIKQLAFIRSCDLVRVFQGGHHQQSRDRHPNVAQRGRPAAPPSLASTTYRNGRPPGTFRAR